MSGVPTGLAAALADRYRIERELGAGGMATVYLAQDLKHDRKVAIKVLRPELAAVIGAERFLSEIKTTAKLQHPHILPLHDSGEASSFLYYVMPFVEGESLRDRLNREKQLPIRDAVRIATEVASALDYAHRHGVIHRDIKPENILLHDGRSHIADFGIALAASKAGSTRMTETGMSLGTPHYMSPEQAMGEREIGAQSDVYALGAVTYELLVGEPPFTGPTAQSIVAKVVTEEPRPLIPKRHTIPPHVEAAVLTALEKLPADRFSSAKQFADALSSPSYSRSTPVFPALRAAEARRWKLTAIAAAFIALACALVALFGWRRTSPPGPVSRYIIAFPDSQFPLVGSLSSDGARLLYLAQETGRQRLWVKEQNQLQGTPVAGTDNPQGFALSPDGQWIGMVQNSQLKKIPVIGGTPVTLADSVYFTGIAWLDDGTLVFSSVSLELTSINQSGSGRKKLWKSPLEDRAPAMLTPLPGGRGVLFTLCNANCSVADLYVYDFKSGTARQLVTDVHQGWYLSTGHLAYVDRAGKMLAAPFDLGRLEIQGDPVPVLSGISMLIGIVPVVTISASGTLLFQTGEAAGQVSAYNLVWVDRAGVRTPIDTGWTFRLDELGVGNNGWDISPDGKRLVIGLSASPGSDLWIKQLPAGPLSRLTFDTTSEQRPRWTPDGQSVTYIGVAGLGLGQRRADGTGAQAILLALPVPIGEGLWSRDGTWLVVRTGGRAGQRGERDIFGMRPGVDSVVRPLAANPNYDEAAPTISPDGKWLAYESDETGTNEVYLRSFPNTDDGKWQVSLNGGQAPLWAHSGRELFFVDSRRNMIVVSVAAGTTPGLGERRILFPVGTDLYLGNPEHYTPFDISIDDQRFIMARQARASTPGRPGTFILVENWFEELKARIGATR